MLKFGFEREFFLLNNEGQYCLIPSKDIPHDDCGWLAEARSEPHTNPTSAVHLLNAAVMILEKQVAKHNITLSTVNTVIFPPILKRQAIRTYGKGPRAQDQGNMYGLELRTNDKFSRAGLHIHFSNSWTLDYFSKDITGEKFTPHHKIIYERLDLPKIISTFDLNFKEEIKQAQRLPGEYALKPHGFEYRSLPQTVNQDKLINVLESIAKQII